MTLSEAKSILTPSTGAPSGMSLTAEERREIVVAITAFQEENDQTLIELGWLKELFKHQIAENKNRISLMRELKKW